MGFAVLPGISLVWSSLGIQAVTVVGLWFGTKGASRAARSLVALAGAHASDRVLVVGLQSERLLAEFVTALSPAEPAVWLPSHTLSGLPGASGAFDPVVYQSFRNGQPGGRDQDFSPIARALAPGGRMVLVELVHAARHADALVSAGLRPESQPAIGWLKRVTISIGLEPDVLRSDKPSPRSSTVVEGATLVPGQH